MQTFDEALLNQLTQTLFYEGYSLYPEHGLALQHKKTIPVGLVFPRGYAAKHVDTHGSIRTQYLLHAMPDAKIDVAVRFLHLVKVDLYRKVNGDFVRTEELTADGNHFAEGWQAMERRIECVGLPVAELPEKRHSIHVTFPHTTMAENIFSETGIVGRRIFRVVPVMGRMEVEASPGGGEDLWRITTRINNQTLVKNSDNMDRDGVLGQSFIAVHIIVKTDSGEFISAQNPPEEYREAIAACRNNGTWPVLLDGENKVMLSSPVFLYDYPRIDQYERDFLLNRTETEQAL